MFREWTQGARRAMFFARYEASVLGSPYVEPEHLLLGVIREDKELTSRFIGPSATAEAIRKEITDREAPAEEELTSVDLPLSKAAKAVIARAKQERVRLQSANLSTQHLLLALLEIPSLASELLGKRGITATKVRAQLETADARPLPAPASATANKGNEDARDVYKEVQDLLADNLQLTYISGVRSSVRSLIQEARRFDRRSDRVDSACRVDTQRSIVLICCRVIGGQQRELTEKDRQLLQEILGFPIPSSDFDAVKEQLRTATEEQLDRYFPTLLRLQAAEQDRIFDPCDSTIRNFENLGSYIAKIFGNKKGKGREHDSPRVLGTAHAR